MFSLRKKKTEPEAQASAVSAGNDLANPLASVHFEGGKYVFDAMPGQANNDNETIVRSRVHETVLRMYGDEKFHSHIVRILGWVGNKKDLTTLKIDKDDEAFKDACDVLYRRLMDGPLGPILDRMSDKTFDDLLVISMGFAPLVWGVAVEVRQKKRKRNVTADNDNKGEENEQS